MLKLMRRVRRVRPVLPPPSAFTGFRFPREVIVLAVRWYLRYGLSYRDVEELLAERGVRVDQLMPRSYTTEHGQRAASYAG
jgi:transposase-like protein